MKNIHYPRWQKIQTEQALRIRRVVLLSGPRQCGKTTLAKEIQTPDSIYRTLDIQNVRESAASDPQSFLQPRNKTFIIDEIQHVPDLLLAIKVAVDEDTRPGQFLLTGSTNIQSLPTVRESLAGRITKIRLRPLAQGEITYKTPKFLQNVFNQ